MIVRDDRGNELLEVLSIDEEHADCVCEPVTHCLAVVRIGNDHLMGWNRWRQEWEIFGGCREKGETLRSCIERECLEELGLVGAEFTWLGLMRLRLAPGYFCSEWRIEFGGLYGVSLPEDTLEKIEKYRTDKEEIDKLSLHGMIREGEKTAKIDEKLLEYWQ